jgi:hypothetical protein
MISELLKNELNARLPEIHAHFNASDGSIVLPGSSDAVGDISIIAGSKELTVCIGNITHCHFENYLPDISEPERSNAIVDDVIEFLDSLLADRVLIWRSGQGGGLRVLDEGETPDVRSDAGTQFYLWSGPIA